MLLAKFSTAALRAQLENILLDKHGNIKVADFGLSNSIKFNTRMTTNCGTPQYTCPEQVRACLLGCAVVVAQFCLLCAVVEHRFTAGSTRARRPTFGRWA